MKKMQYLQPQTDVVLINTNVQLLSGSPNTIKGDAPEANLDPNSMSEGNGGDAASRRSLWDDDDDF